MYTSSGTINRSKIKILSYHSLLCPMESLATTKFLISFFSCLLLLTLLNPVFAIKVCEFPAIFNFGDWNSDTGGLSASIWPSPPPNGDTYFHRPSGRLSDGRLIIDFIGIGSSTFGINASFLSLSNATLR